MIRRLTAFAGAALVAFGLIATQTGSATAATATCPTGNYSISNVTYVMKGMDGSVRTTHTLWNNTRAGDQITVTFKVAAGCTNIPVSFASYRAPSPVWEGSNVNQQELYNSSTGLFSAGTGTLSVNVPTAPGIPGPNCPNTFSAPNSNGANASGPYDTTCDGSPSLNGNSTNNNSNKPCAGCVGNADNKNPKGQLPNAATDGNNGYECDNNNGVGKSNPAHSGCTTNYHYQVDFVRGAVIEKLGPEGTDNFYTVQGRLLDTDLG